MVTSISQFTETSLERLPVEIFENPQKASIYVAEAIAKVIRDKQNINEMAVLGLATGSTPILIYKELVRMHKDENLSFANVITFNLDEYYPMRPGSPHSYHHFMQTHLFGHIDILQENIHIPDGTLELHELPGYCHAYEEKIKALDGLDIQLLGIGRTGHIGFNEPGSLLDSETRLVKLDPLTISDATEDFVREEYVPRRAITMGVRSIFKARKIFLAAWGGKKASIVQQAVEGQISEEIPASFLQNHDNTEVIIDEHAGLELTRIKTPWIVSVCDWDKDLAKRAVIWLSQKLETPILKLTDEDYKEQGLGDLLAYCDGSQTLNVEVFNTLQNTITGWPGGKPHTDDTNRPERAEPAKKRVVIFSPHPDDDVISMGGTFLKLVEQGHEVHVAYQTSGNIAVFDDDARRFAEFARDFAAATSIGADQFEDQYASVVKSLAQKEFETQDTTLVRTIKGLIRKGEATAGARYCGLPDPQIHFLNMPFYETGAVDKKRLGDKDIDIVTTLLRDVRPHQVFAAGDLRDPHGTHKVCLDAIIEALRLVKKEQWSKDCYLWLYRGAWQEWDIQDIQMAVPLSPSDLLKKRKAIFKHQSQKDSPVFPGNDKREFWQRAEARNRQTAKLYDQLGLAEYEAIEAFVRYVY